MRDILEVILTNLVFIILLTAASTLVCVGLYMLYSIAPYITICAVVLFIIWTIVFVIMERD